MGNPILKIHTNGLLPLLLASLALPVSAQVSSENYVQTTQRISDTRVLATTQYYDGLDRPFEKVEQRVSPSGDNLIHLQQYDGLGRNMQDGNLRKQGQWLFSQYYGKKGRVVQSHSSNLLGGWEHTYSSYTYADSPRQTKHVHTTNGKQDVVEEYDYAYDHASRLVKTTYSVNGSDKRELSVVDYDNYGRILLENIMGKDEVLYDYNAQNMLTDSGYNEGDRQNDGQGNYDESLSYDKMGNVQSLLRSGLLDDGSYGLIDNLSYSYHGNQLLKVDDAAVGPYYQGAFHFVDGADEAVEYEYDANGNLVRDLNKCISSISYDLNNQPRKIEYNDGRNASYVYDAEGNKLSVSYNLTAMSSAQPQMPVMQSSNVASANMSNGQKTIEYCGNIICDGDETMILNNVGYALYNKDNNLSFYYYLKDHLGNNRVVVREYGEIEQVNDYYPTGALMTSSKGGDTQRFKYNGKELDRTNGLNWYGYGARNYDAAIVRWDGMDKLCEKYSPFTPYGYCLNRFLNYYDKIGNEPGDFFLSKNAAAMDFGLFYNGISILEKREYISPIVAVSDKYGNSGYTYLWPSVGTEYKSKISSYPLGHPVAALVHTHGNFSAYTDNYFSGQLTRRGKTRLLSERELKLVINSPNMPTDIGTSNKLGKEVYLVSPNGQLQKYNPKDGKILKISNQMPSDPQDPSRKNQKLLNIKRVDFMDYLTKVFKLFINPQKF
ncbi:MAG: DUF4329 domain-containing protein [Prevotella sp.]|nr:DUF4329 domain-containing protein [Prevotella sp.]